MHAEREDRVKNRSVWVFGGFVEEKILTLAARTLRAGGRRFPRGLRCVYVVCGVMWGLVGVRWSVHGCMFMACNVA